MNNTVDLSASEELSAEIKEKYPNGVYTSDTVHRIPEAGCEPCDDDEAGDEHSFNEVIPYKMNPDTARVICTRDPEKTDSDDNPCAFNKYTVTINNPGRIATIVYRSRSKACLIRLQTDIIGK